MRTRERNARFFIFVSSTWRRVTNYLDRFSYVEIMYARLGRNFTTLIYKLFRISFVLFIYFPVIPKDGNKIYNTCFLHRFSSVVCVREVRGKMVLEKNGPRKNFLQNCSQTVRQKNARKFKQLSFLSIDSTTHRKNFLTLTSRF